ncbi:MAG: hypothetical protein AB1414_08550 [bacterium]
MEICCFPQSISTYFYKFQSISIILSPYHSYLLIPFLTLLIYSLNGYQKGITNSLKLQANHHFVSIIFYPVFRRLRSLKEGHVLIVLS